MKTYKPLVKDMMKTPRLAGLLALVKAENEEENEVTYDYDALTPSLMNEKDAKHYINALNFACHKPDIKNIAVTGPYGAGKSSVLLTWTRSREDRKHIMTVSLADFDMVRGSDVSVDKNSEEPTKSDRKARQEEKSIEYSILQQILYKARKSDLPYSRIDRIADFTSAQVWAKALHLLGMTVSCLSGLMLLFPQYFRKRLSLPVNFSEFLLSFHPALRTGLAGVAFFITFYLLISKLHRMGIFDRRLSIDKIDLSKGATLSTRPADPSLLNVFIDEIVYFFDKKKYKVVIFEDLDRHNDGAIFIKLREINQIINNSLSDEQPVRFIYAVRDDIFNSPEARTKFFDFIVPVVPVLDSQNATDHFSKKFESDDLKVPGFEQCIARLAVFITDMRLLNSIANEFRLYRKLVNNGQDIIRLLSLISYKNLCARDYHLIDAKQGILYGIMSAYISGQLRISFIEEITREIKSLDIEIAEISREEKNTNPDIIRDILKEYISDKTKQQLQFYSQNGVLYNLDDIAKDEALFLDMMKSPGLYVRESRYGTNIANLGTSSVTQILDEYSLRSELASSKHNGKLIALHLKKEQFLKHIRRLEASSPGVLIQKMGSEGFRTWVSEHLGIAHGSESEDYDTLQYDFIYALLRWHYLSTDYMSYRSVFIPGSLSSNDNDFVHAVSAGKDLIFTTAMPLDRTPNVVKKIRDLGLLHQENAWHADVLLHLLAHDRSRLSRIMDLQLEEGEEVRLAYLTEGPFGHWAISDVILYVQLMTSDRPKTSRFVKALVHIIEFNAAVQLLVLFFCTPAVKWDTDDTDMNKAFIKIFSCINNIADRVPDGYGERFVANLKSTQSQLPLIGQCVSEQGKKIVMDIAKNQLWAYSAGNFENILLLLSEESRLTVEQIMKKPLTAVREIKVQGLEKTIQNNIEHFIMDFILRSEDYDMVPELLNNEGVGFNFVSDIISKMNFLVDDVSKIKNREGVLESLPNISASYNTYELLLSNNRVNPSWENVFFLAKKQEEEEIPSPKLAMWFDRYHSKFESPSLPLTDDNLHLIFSILFNSGAMSDEGRISILNLFGFPYSVIPSYMHFDSIHCLINQKLLNPSQENFDDIRQRYSEEGKKRAPLLAGLIFQNPLLLQSPEAVILDDNEFDNFLTEQLFQDDSLTEKVQTQTLTWIWDQDEEIFRDTVCIPAARLAQLAPHLENESLRRTLLLQSLKTGNISHEAISRVIASFSDPAVLAFASDSKFRSMDLAGEQLALARLLESAGFIRSLNSEKKEGRFRFTPHNSPVF